MNIHQRSKALCLTAFWLGLIWFANMGSVNAQFTLEFTNGQVTNTPVFSDIVLYDFTIVIDEDLAPGVFSNPTLASVEYRVRGDLVAGTPSGFSGFDLRRTIGGDEFYSQGSSLDFEIAADADLTDGLQIADLVGTGTVFELNAREVGTGRYHPALLRLNSDGTGQLQNGNNFGGVNPFTMEVVNVAVGVEYITDLTFNPSALTIARMASSTQTITHVPLFTFDGDSSGDTFGVSVSGAGDVNGDGRADLIVGASNDNNNGENSGSARVLSGRDGSVLFNFDGDSNSDFFGRTVSGAGDVNGDGRDDLIIGVHLDDNIGESSGSARVLSGRDGSVLYNFDGDSAGDQFGRSVSGAGDVNGDGRDDLIVGASLDDTNNGANSGSARVLSGIDGSVLYTFNGDSAGDLFGDSVSGAGDVNGDGRADLIVGAALDDNNNRSSGSARVLSGIDGSVLYTFNGDSPGILFGSSVSSAGDVNGDGRDDLIVGAPGADNAGENSGSVRVLSGIDGSILYDFNGNGAGEGFGESVSCAGDVNGDGRADLIVGAPFVDGGSARVLSGIDGSVLYTFNGDADVPAEGFGTSVSGAGDLNGDGIDDFIVGAVRGGANGGGYARVFVSQVSGQLLGDVNRDGVVNFSDIPAFISLLIAGDYQVEADTNEDGYVDFSDIPPFILILQGA